MSNHCINCRHWFDDEGDRKFPELYGECTHTKIKDSTCYYLPMPEYPPLTINPEPFATLGEFGCIFWEDIAL